MEATQMSINRQMDREDVVCIYRQYYSPIKRNDIGSFVDIGLWA